MCKCTGTTFTPNFYPAKSSPRAGGCSTPSLQENQGWSNPTKAGKPFFTKIHCPCISAPPAPRPKSWSKTFPLYTSLAKSSAKTFTLRQGPRPTFPLGPAQPSRAGLTLGAAPKRRRTANIAHSQNPRFTQDLPHDLHPPFAPYISPHVPPQWDTW
jgi:hypothetical protein